MATATNTITTNVPAMLRSVVKTPELRAGGDLWDICSPYMWDWLVHALFPAYVIPFTHRDSWRRLISIAEYLQSVALVYLRRLRGLLGDAEGLY
jgi:hypothetical protein